MWCMPSHFSSVQLFASLWTVALQAPLSMGFSRQEHWSGFQCGLSGDLPDPGIKPVSLVSPVLAGRFFTTGTTWEAPCIHGSFNSFINFVLFLFKKSVDRMTHKWLMTCNLENTVLKHLIPLIITIV